MRLATQLCSIVFLSASLHAQVTEADYQRASGLRTRFQGLAIGVPGPVTWIDSAHFWYRKSVQGGNAFVLVNAETQAKSPAFDHEKLAVSLSAAAGEKYTAVTLPFSEFTFADGQRALQFTVGDSNWRCELSDYTCKKTGSA